MIPPLFEIVNKYTEYKRTISVNFKADTLPAGKMRLCFDGVTFAAREERSVKQQLQ